MTSELEAILSEDEVWRSRLAAAEAQARSRLAQAQVEREAARARADDQAATDLEDEVAAIEAAGEQAAAQKRAARKLRLAEREAAAEAVLDDAAARFAAIVLGLEAGDGAEARVAPAGEGEP